METFYKLILVLLIITVDLHSCYIDKLRDDVRELKRNSADQKHIDSVNNHHYRIDSIKRALNH